MGKSYTDISLFELEEMAVNPDSIVVDVREPWEFEEFNIGGINIPLADIRERRAELLPFRNIIVVCTNGTRSRVAAKDYCRAESFLQKQIYHLEGGILEVE
ncbi:rhodanese-like domain-containing protein [Runella sp.]|jgi:rhodanese-related sulfurtransferase|uniref:rhodanese-like domain-containing protein n=1 Tax=Runella sp. TaxID=1960881 RepID=UPI0030194C34